MRAAENNEFTRSWNRRVKCGASEKVGRSGGDSENWKRTELLSVNVHFNRMEVRKSLSSNLTFCGMQYAQTVLGCPRRPPAAGWLHRKQTQIMVAAHLLPAYISPVS